MIKQLHKMTEGRQRNERNEYSSQLHQMNRKCVVMFAYACNRSACKYSCNIINNN